MIPPTIDTIEVQTKTQSGLFIINQADYQIKLQPRTSDLYLPLQPIILTGDLDQIINLDVILRNQVSNQTFSPRAIRFINYLK